LRYIISLIIIIIIIIIIIPCLNCSLRPVLDLSTREGWKAEFN